MSVAELSYSDETVLVDWTVSGDDGEPADPFAIASVRVFKAERRGSLLDTTLVGSVVSAGTSVWDSRAFGTAIVAAAGDLTSGVVSDPAPLLRDGLSHYWDDDSVYVVPGDGTAARPVAPWWIRQNCAVVSADGHRLRLDAIPSEQVSDVTTDAVYWTYAKSGFVKSAVFRSAPGVFYVPVVVSKLFSSPGEYWFEIAVVETEGSVPELFHFSVRVSEPESLGEHRRIAWNDGEVDWRGHFYRATPNLYFNEQNDPLGLHRKFVDVVARGAWKVQQQVDRWLTLRDRQSAPRYALPMIAQSLGWKLRTEETSLWRNQLDAAPQVWSLRGTLSGLRLALDSCGVSLLAYREYDQIRPRMFHTDHFFFTERVSEKEITVDPSIACDVPAWGDRFDRDGDRILYNPVFRLSRSPAWTRVATAAVPDLSAVKVDVRDTKSRQWHSVLGLPSRGIRPVQDSSDQKKWSDRVELEIIGAGGLALPKFEFSDLAEFRITYPVATNYSDVSADTADSGFTTWDQAGAKAAYTLSVDQDLWPSSLAGWGESSGSDPSDSSIKTLLSSDAGGPSTVIAASVEPDVKEVLNGNASDSVLGEIETHSAFPLHQVPRSVAAYDVSLSFSGRAASSTLEFEVKNDLSGEFSWEESGETLNGSAVYPEEAEMAPPLGRWLRIDPETWSLDSIQRSVRVIRDGADFSLPPRLYRVIYSLVDGVGLVVVPLSSGEYPLAVGDTVSIEFEFDRIKTELPAFPIWYNRDSIVCDWNDDGELIVQENFDPAPFQGDQAESTRTEMSLEPLCDWSLVSDAALIKVSDATSSSTAASVVSVPPSGLSLSLAGIRDVSPATPEAKRSRLESMAGFYVDPALSEFTSYSVIGTVLDSNGFVAAVFAAGTGSPSDAVADDYFWYVRRESETATASGQALSAMPVTWTTSIDGELTFSVDLAAALSSPPDVSGGSIDVWYVAESAAQRHEASDHGVPSAWHLAVRPLVGSETSFPAFGDGSPVKWVKRTSGGLESYSIRWDTTVAERPSETSVLRFAYPLRYAFRARAAWSNQSRKSPETEEISGPAVGSVWVTTRWDRWAAFTEFGSPSKKTAVSIDATKLLSDATKFDEAAICRFFSVGLAFFTRTLTIEAINAPVDKRPREVGVSPVGDDRYRVKMIDRRASIASDVSLWDSPCLLTYVLTSNLGLSSVTLTLPEPQNGDVVSLSWVYPPSPRHADLLEAVVSGKAPPPVSTVDEALADQDWLEAYVLSLPLADKRDVRDLRTYAEWETQIRSQGWSSVRPAVRPDANVRLIGSDDPISKALCGDEAWPQRVVFGRVRTAVPYGSTVYGAEEYDGSVLPSEDPSDMDESFREPCSCCPSSRFGLDLSLGHCDGMVEETEALDIVREMVPAGSQLARVTFRRSFDAGTVASDSVAFRDFLRVSADVFAAHGFPEDLVSDGAARGPSWGQSRVYRAAIVQTDGLLEVDGWVWELDLPESRLSGRGRVHGGQQNVVEASRTTRSGLTDADGNPRQSEWYKFFSVTGQSDAPRSVVVMGDSAWSVSARAERAGSPLYGVPTPTPSGDVSGEQWEMYNVVVPSTSGALKESRLVELTVAGFDWSEIDVHVGDLVTIREEGALDKTANLVKISGGGSLVVEPMSPRPVSDIAAWCALGVDTAKSVTLTTPGGRFRRLIKTPEDAWLAEQRLASREWLAAQFSISLEPNETIATHPSLSSWTTVSMEPIGFYDWNVGWSVNGGDPRPGDRVWWSGEHADSAEIVEVKENGVVVLEPVSGTQPTAPSTATGTAMRRVLSGNSGAARLVPSSVTVRTAGGETFEDMFGSSVEADIESLAVKRLVVSSQFGGTTLFYSVSSCALSAGPTGTEAVVVSEPKRHPGSTVSAVSVVGVDDAFTFSGLAFSASLIGAWLVDLRRGDWAEITGRATSSTEYDTLLTDSSWTTVPSVGDTLVVSTTNPATRIGVPVSLGVLTPEAASEKTWPADVSDPVTFEQSVGEHAAWSPASRGLRVPEPSAQLEAIDMDGGMPAGASSSPGASCRLTVRHAGGVWSYKNTTESVIVLPIPSFDGKTRIQPGGVFTGSSFFGSVAGVVAQELVQSGTAVEIVGIE